MWSKLPPIARVHIRDNAAHVGLDVETGEDIVFNKSNKDGVGGWQWAIKDHRMNALDALVDQWLQGGILYNDEARFLQVLELAGLNDELKKAGMNPVEYIDPDRREEKVYDAFLGITKPFDAAEMVNDQFVQDFLDWYEEQPEGKYDRESRGADFWDKNSIDAETFADRMRNDIESGNSHAWTSIPDSMTDYLKSLGYNGIQDKGGKGGGEAHTVWIPFSSEQVKSAELQTYDNEGNVIPLSERFNSEEQDIRYSIEA